VESGSPQKMRPPSELNRIPILLERNSLSLAVALAKARRALRVSRGPAHAVVNRRIRP
jgi:hypothetical protein